VVVVTGAGVVSFSGSKAEFGSVIHDGRVNPRPLPAITLRSNQLRVRELDGFGSNGTYVNKLSYDITTVSYVRTTTVHVLYILLYTTIAK